MKADADYWKGFWAGRAIAVRLAGLGMNADSDWYLYNGVRLPKLPELTEEQKATYKYALIYKEVITDDTKLILAKTEMVYLSFIRVIAFGWETQYQYLEYTLQDSEFVFRVAVDGDYGVATGGGIFNGDFIWTSHDIREELDDLTLGEVVYSASDPIPTT